MLSFSFFCWEGGGEREGNREDHQTIIGIDALKHMKSADQNPLLGFKTSHLFQLRTEVLQGKSTVFLNRAGEVALSAVLCVVSVPMVQCPSRTTHLRDSLCLPLCPVVRNHMDHLAPVSRGSYTEETHELAL